MLENMNKALERINSLKQSFKALPVKRNNQNKQTQSFNETINSLINTDKPQNAENAENAENADNAEKQTNAAANKTQSTQNIIKSLNRDVEALIQKYSAKHGLSPQLVKNLIAITSGNNPLAVGKNGELGLMQLSPMLLKAAPISNPFDPQQNIEAGTKYLAELIKQNGSSIARGLSAYGAEPSQIGQICGFNPYSSLLGLTHWPTKH